LPTCLRASHRQTQKKADPKKPKELFFANAQQKNKYLTKLKNRIDEI